MKRCPTCQQTYDDSVKFCRLDGTLLNVDPAASDSAVTMILPAARTVTEIVTQTGDAHPAIAVLPFVNISADQDNEYFCDGLAEELLNALAKIEGLKVAARTSSFSFKGKDLDVREIGRKLAVETILEGSVRKVGEQLRITAQLINVRDGYRTWSKRYDREAVDVFKIQDELSLDIVNCLKLKISGTRREALIRRYTDNEHAYLLYLKGRYHQNRWTPEGIRKSVEYFDEAIRIDSNYALAYAGLADSYSSLGAAHAFGLCVKETSPRARDAALKALEIDDSLAEAHSSLALVKLNFEFDWPGAEQEFKRAIELNPNYSSAYHWYSHYLIAMGRMEESLTMSRLALELDPLDLETNIHLAWHFYFARDYEQALKVSAETLEIDPNFTEAHWFAGWAYEQQGRYAEAIASYVRGGLLQEREELWALLGHAHGLSGNQIEARKFLDKIKEGSEGGYVSPYSIAVVYLGLNEVDEAFAWLYKALEERNAWLVYLNVNPIFDSLRSDSRFKDLLARMGLVS